MSFESFLRSNAKMVDRKKVYVSERFTNIETGEIVPFVIKPLSSQTMEEIKNEMAINVNDAKKGSIISGRQQTNSENLMLIESIVEPDLTNMQLQDSYGAMGEADLIDKMLLIGEKSRLVEAIAEFNGFDDSKINEKVDAIKNY